MAHQVVVEWARCVVVTVRGTRSRGALAEQLDRRSVRTRSRQRAEGDDVLAVDRQRFTARRQDPQVIAVGEHRRHDGHDQIDDVLAVVEHDEGVDRAETDERSELPARASVAGRAQAMVEATPEASATRASSTRIAPLA